ncbi:MAG: DUF3445 domain-containing protein [Devosia sp.]
MDIPSPLPRAFQIGLKPLDPNDWIEVTERLAPYLAEKARLLAVGAPVFVAEPGTEAAQVELLGMLAAYLPVRYPALYRREENLVLVVPAGHSVHLDDAATPALQRAAMLVEDDLVLMRKGETGWRLVAGSLSFPSSWSLLEKFGKPMHEVHGPVPEFGAGTRNAGLIERMFDNLRPATPVIRWNWSLFEDARLHHPEAGHPDVPRFGMSGEHAVLRLERQTLLKLPESRDIVFSIRISVEPIVALRGRPDGPAIAAGLAEQLRGLSEEQAAYKGLLLEREALLAQLDAIA